MNRLKLIGLNLILLIGISSSVGFAYSNQQDNTKSNAGAVLTANTQQKINNCSVSTVSNSSVVNKENCSINAAGGCSGCGSCNGQCFER